MDHQRQIPQVGRDRDPILEPYVALAWMAARTERIRLGTLVTPVTFRNLSMLAKAVATLDVLSGGRMTCGLGLGWYEREHRAAAIDFPTREDRYELLEDALEALPLLWGPGSPAFRGRRVEIPEAIGYPRPLQARIPILVGGGGEQRTLKLAAHHADAVNVMGDPDVVARKVAVLRRHCAAIDRDPGEIRVTVLAPTLLGRDRGAVRDLVDRLRPPRVTADRYAAAVHAGTVEDHLDRLRAFGDAGVHEVIVSLPALGLDGGDDDVAAVAAFAPITDALRAG
jgi:alkanesulfonate monooxygenase SsuD/methylene tetrahydromethanopterin reductase-like flavin-dependent oxidoreductase (luciferase family)